MREGQVGDRVPRGGHVDIICGEWLGNGWVGNGWVGNGWLGTGWGMVGVMYLGGREENVEW